MSTDNKKDHADFQSKYNQSKNFKNEAKDEEFKVEGEGKLKLADEELMSEEKKKKIADAMDNMRRGLENTDERVARKEEE